MRIAFYTLGCKVNQYDTQLMRDLLERIGHQTVDFKQKADCYIINTCTVTNMSDRKSRQIISRCKEQNPKSIIVVCGCFSQISSDKVAAIDGVNIIIGTANRKNIVKYLEEYLQNQTQIIQPADLQTENQLTGETVLNFHGKTRAILKIEDGCQNFCTYCTIPFARGNIRSKSLKDIKTELENLIKDGYKEVVLTGIHLSSYGKDLKNIDLADVINFSSEFPFSRIRLGSLEPNIITKPFLEKIKNVKTLMPSFHLSLQSGSNSVLRRMNRHYTAETYQSAVALLREYYPNAAITTDIIVGFPGESEIEFTETISFTKEIAFSKIHIFPYSARLGTKAADMPDQINSEVKAKRVKELELIEQSLRLSFMKKQIGSVVPVLFEQKKNDLWHGYTENYLPVLVKSNYDLENQIQNVFIIETDDNQLVGEIL